MAAGRTGGGADRPGGAATLTVPLARWPGYAYFDLAAQRGLAEPNGLTLRTINLDDPQEGVPAFSRGGAGVGPGHHA